MKNILLSILISAGSSVFFGVSYGQTPSLGATSSFTLFTASGAFSNVGSSDVTGDIGTDVGALTGFPPGILVGQIHVADSLSALAAIDVNTLYTYLAGITCGVIIGTELGNGQTLTPNVYCLGAISTLNGNLFLDGQGDPNALFIFKIDGAFSTNLNSNIVLLNSASLGNVYWQVNGAFSLGDSSFFNGTVVTNGAISLLNNSSLSGRGLSTGGAISLDDNLVSLGTPIDPLPIELLNFDGQQVGTEVKLNWSTASETNNDYFTLQHSKDAIFFKDVLQVQGAGNSTTALPYSAVDEHPYNGISYYRLKQTDFDGKFTLSKIAAVNYEKPIEFTIYPNPFTISINVMIRDTLQAQNYELRIYNVLGAEMMNRILTTQSTNLGVDKLPSGIYFYTIMFENKILQSGKLVSQQ